MIYQYDGDIIQGDDVEQVIEALKDGSSGWQSHLNTESYMQSFSDRYKQVFGQSLPTDSSKNFIQALIDKGILTKIND